MSKWTAWGIIGSLFKEKCTLARNILCCMSHHKIRGIRATAFGAMGE
jgi:hypothetical protein